MNWTTETKIKAGFALAVALLLAVAALAWHDTRQLAEDNRLVAHSYEVQDKLGDLLSELQDVETGARGYIITGKEEFLEPYERGRVQAGLLVEKLRRLLVDPGQQAWLKALDPVVVERIAQSGKVVELRRSQGLAAATAEVGKGEGKRLMDQIRQQIGVMNREQQLLLTLSEQQTLDSARRTLAVFIVGVGFNAVLLGFLFYSTRRERATRRQAENVERTARANLERLVLERTAELAQTNEALQADIAARQQAERWAETLLHSVEGVVWEADAQTFAFTFVSQQAERLLGYPLSRWTGEATFWADHIHPDDRDQAVRYCVTCTAKKEDHDFEYRMLAADGRVVWLKDLVTVIVEAGKAVKLRGIMVDISERKRAEATLLESEERFRTMFTEAPTGIALIDSLTGQIREVNPKFAQIAGRTTEEMRRIDWMQITHPDDVQEDLDNMAQLNAGKITGFQMNKRYLSPDGSVVWINMTIAPILVADRAHPHHLCMIEDITARKQSEAALVASEGQLRNLIEGVNVGIVVHAPDTRILRHNQTALALLGLAGEQMLGKVALDPGWCFVHEDKTPLPVAEYPVTCVIATHAPVQAIVLGIIRPLTNDCVWVLVNAFPEFASDGQLQEVVVTFVDITARQQAEATLVREHELLRTVIDNLPGYIFVKDTAGRYLVSNHAHAQLMCGPDETKLLGKTAFDFLPEEAARAFSADDDAVMRTGQPVVDREETTEADGQRRWYRLTKVPLRDEHGQIVGLVGIKHDITAKKELESQFLRSQRMEAIGTLAGGVAHDLNNALAPILMATEFMRSRSNDADTEQLLDTVAACAQRGAGMVRQLLTFARGAEGEHGPVQLTHLIKEMASLARQTFPKNIEARTDYPPDLWTILGNPTQLHQVLLNLCVNARDAMPTGGTLTLAAANVRLGDDCAALSPDAQPGPHVVLTVTDTGTGMTPEVRARIFEAFFTTKPPGVGTGLGLSTINGIVKAHGGFITVQSAVGRGTEFKVFLPAQEVAAAAPVVADASLPRGQGELILVVDDEPNVVGVAALLLTMFGYRVVTAKNGVEAVAAFIRRADEVQLLITDMDMPTMGGAATIAALRNLAPKLKVIVSSGMSATGHAESLSSLAVQAFLHKPYTAEQLLRLVNEVLHGEKRAG